MHSFIGDKILFICDLESVSENQFKTTVLKKHSSEFLREKYEATFKELMPRLHSGEFQKVILSRTKSVKRQKSPLAIFNSLNLSYRNTFNYIVSNGTIGTWMGATPEVLLNAVKTTVNTMSLAGTKQEHEEWTPKELEEQDLVTQTIINGFKQVNCKELKVTGPTTLKAGHVQHLHTHIKAVLTKKEDWKKLVSALHPTPAVCGIPTNDARNFILENEGYERKFYTGFLGLITAKEKQLFVNLRCMEIFEDTALLYLGGGITAPSVMEKEWQETERKALTLERQIE